MGIGKKLHSFIEANGIISTVMVKPAKRQHSIKLFSAMSVNNFGEN